MKKVVITGGTGFIGKSLCAVLKSKYEIIVLTRNPEKFKKDKSNITYLSWKKIDELASILNGSYAIINLAGENIGMKRWTRKQKAEIISSRTVMAYSIKEAINQCKRPPMVWIQASAVGIYGQQGDGGEYATEESKIDKYSFLANVCKDWEQPIRQFNGDIRKLIIRSGVVLSPKSLVLKQILLPFKFGVAVVTGKGENILPWISLNDEVRAIQYLLENEECSGIFNLVAPNSISMNTLVKELRVCKKAFIKLHVPELCLELVFGKQMTSEIILTNQLISPKALLDAGFIFEDAEIDQALDRYFK